VLADDRPGAVITRWLLPAAVVTPLAAGWLQMGAERVGLIDAAVGAGLLTLGMIIVIGVLALWIARELDRMDLRRQGAENEARTRRDELQVVLASIGDGVIALDEAARVRFLNPAAERLTGRAAAAAIGRSVEEVVELVDERTGEAIALPLERALREGAHTLAAGEPAVLMPEGTAHAVDVAAVPILGAESEALGVVVVLRDAAARREAERAMRKSYAELDRRVIERTRLLGAVTASTQDLVCARDREGRILLANPAWLRAVGKEASEVIGRTAIESGIDAEPSREQADAEREVIETGTPHVAEETRGGGGEPGTFRVVKSPLRDEQGRIVGLLSVATDISERKLAERELETLLAAEQRMRAEAERANRAKDEFLAIVSHELRSPLNALRGWSHLLARTRPLDPALAERATAAIKRNVEHQARLIDDLLDTSRIMSGKLTLERRPLNLVEVVHAALEVARPAAGAKHVELRSQFDHPVVTVEGDAGRLQQVLTNLLSNAIKFTPENGRVEASVAVIGQHVRLVVRDSGIGIAADFLPHVFDRFSQADTSTTRRTGGLGIGLALVRHLVELHGGTVRAESAGEGQGAAFTIDLPAPRLAVWTPSGVPPPSERGSITSALAGRRVFVVDDDPDARETITFTLRHDGAAVQAFESGAELLGQLAPAARGEWPDVLLLDLAMPGEDGFAVLARLRELERGRALAPPLPTIAVTAFTQTDRERLAVAGFHDLVGKPVDGDRLVRAIVAVLEASARRDPAAAAPQSAFDSAT
jgi:PAS domain S-box-containing protein